MIKIDGISNTENDDGKQEERVSQIVPEIVDHPLLATPTTAGRKSTARKPAGLCNRRPTGAFDCEGAKSAC